MTVVDLGSAPGSWSQIAAKLTGERGMVVASDILEMDHLGGVTFLQGDFREESVFNKLLEILDGRRVDIVISDMAPNTSGNSAVDQPRMMYLCELALDFASKVLDEKGQFLVKVFQGEGFDEYRKAILKSLRSLKQSSRRLHVLVHPKCICLLKGGRSARSNQTIANQMRWIPKIDGFELS